MHHSNITNNGLYEVHLSSKGDSLTIMDGENNWWGTTDSSQIESMVYHKNDYSAYPFLDFMPCAMSEYDLGDPIPTDVPEPTEYDLPSSFTLHHNHPNPFNPTTEISFTLSEPADVTLDIFNILGQKVTVLVDRKLGAGLHNYQWDAGAAASGVYLYRVSTNNYTRTMKMLLLK